MTKYAARIALKSLVQEGLVMRLDGILSEEGLLAKGEFYGVESWSKTTERYPFVLLEDGDIDYGDWCDPPERFMKSNFRKRFMRSGEIVTFDSEGGSHEYQIIKVTRTTA
ncbi:MAG: hypothetical protein J0L81_13845 [Caulobacterales bacterium]|jgi:hypothetical protein|nr:hypothetical protein [Caulobacterales bacterium]